MQGWQEPQLPLWPQLGKGRCLHFRQEVKGKHLGSVESPGGHRWSRDPDLPHEGSVSSGCPTVLGRSSVLAEPTAPWGKASPSRSASPFPHPPPACTHRVLPVLPVVGVGTQRSRHIWSPGAAPASDSRDRPPQSRQAQG